MFSVYTVFCIYLLGLRGVFFFEERRLRGSVGVNERERFVYFLFSSSVVNFCFVGFLYWDVFCVFFGGFELGCFFVISLGKDCFCV